MSAKLSVRERLTWAATIIGAVIVVLLCLTFWGWFSATPDNAAVAPPHHSGTSLDNGSEVRHSDQAGVDSSVRAERAEAASPATSSETEAPPLVEQDSKLLVRFVDREGAPLPSFRFRWIAVNPDQRRALRASSPLELPPLDNLGEADINGAVSIAMNASDFLILQSDDPSYLHAGTLPLPTVDNRLDPVLYDCHRIPPGVVVHEALSRWERAFEVDLLIRYADHERFDGRVRWQAYDPANPGALAHPVVHENERCPYPLTLRGPMGMAYRVVAENSRAGFQSITDWHVPLTEADDGQRTRDLVIPASARKAPSIIEVDCTALPADANLEKIVLTAYDATGSSFDVLTIPKSRIARSRPFVRYGSNRVAVQMSGEYVWRSETFEIEPGETIRLVALPGVGGTVRARIVNEAGEPLYPAGLFLCVDSNGHRWVGGFDGASMDGVRAFAARDGIATLTGTPAGRWTFVADAPGYLTESRNGTIAAGGYLDLGDIQLRRTLGEVTVIVKLPEGADATTYRCILPIAGGGGHFEGDTPLNSEGRVVFRNVAPGIYNVYVFVVSSESRAQGATGWGKHVTVNEDSVEVHIDATAPHGHQE
jgi:hypothetical protein